MNRFYYLVTFLFCISVVPYAGCNLGPFEPQDLNGRKIAFLSTQNSIRSNIFLMNEDGSDQTQITYVVVAYGIKFLAWSPDASRIVYSDNSGSTDGPVIYMINADGTGNKSIGSGVFYDANNEVSMAMNFEPSWSPDGSRIVYVKWVGGRTSNIYIMNADGSNETRITENSADKRTPSWSPDGKRIAYSSENDRGYDIYTIGTDGSNKIRLTYLEADYQNPYWSPDGSKILFRSLIRSLKGNLSEIYVMDSDGTNLTKLTDNNGFSQHPAWSPDGSQIVFSSNLSGDFEIYTINADGSNISNVSHNPGNDISPSWSPDGAQIVFSSTQDDVWLIHAIQSDGTNVRVLAQGWFPVWQPVLR